MTNAATLGSFGDASNVGLMFRNKIINGDMRIDQRKDGATQTFTAAAALAYSVDRWYGYCTGANVTGARIAGTGTQYAYRFTGAASVTAIGFAQRIESANAYQLAGLTSTLSVDLANSLLTTVTWTAYYANTADTFGTLASPTRTQIATGTFTVTSTVTRYQTQIAIPAAATTGIEIVFTVGAQTSGTWTIQNVQLEAGSAATPFEVRPIGLELSLCQRYYYRYAPTASNEYIANMQAYATTSVQGVVLYLPVEMRADAGVVGLSSATHISAYNAAGTSVAAFSSSGSLAGTKRIIRAGSFGGASGLAAGNCSLIIFNTTSGWIDVSSEL